jgi:hypothetical protein
MHDQTVAERHPSAAAPEKPTRANKHKHVRSRSVQVIDQGQADALAVHSHPPSPAPTSPLPGSKAAAPQTLGSQLQVPLTNLAAERARRASVVSSTDERVEGKGDGNGNENGNGNGRPHVGAVRESFVSAKEYA